MPSSSDSQGQPPLNSFRSLPTSESLMATRKPRRAGAQTGAKGSTQGSSGGLLAGNQQRAAFPGLPEHPLSLPTLHPCLESALTFSSNLEIVVTTSNSHTSLSGTVETTGQQAFVEPAVACADSWLYAIAVKQIGNATSCRRVSSRILGHASANLSKKK